MRLSISNATATKVISVTNVAPAKPYININGYYVPVTTATIAGTKVKIQSGTVTYRACEYQSGYYNTTSAAVGNLSSTTALTRASTSGTNYGTRASTSGTNYGTRASTSGTSYLTRASTSGTNYGTRASTSGTSYLTRASTSGTSYLTRASTSGTTYLTRASTSATITNYTYTSSNASSLKITEYYQMQSRANWSDKLTLTAQYYTINPVVGKITPANVRVNNFAFSITNSAGTLSMKSGGNVSYNRSTITFGSPTAGRVLTNQNSGTIKASSSQGGYPWYTAVVNVYRYESTVAANKLNATGVFRGLSTSLVAAYATGTLFNMTEVYYSENLVASTWPTYQTRASTSGTNYGTRASTSGTSYLTRASTSGTSYLTRASTSGTTYLTRASTSGTSYLTRASTSGTTYLTRASTSGTTYLTRSSTSGYSGKLSSSKWA